MGLRRAPSEIGIVLYPGAQAAAVHGLTDLFCLANGFSAEDPSASKPRVRVTHWHLGSAKGELASCIYSSDPPPNPRPGILILPPTLAGLPEPETCTRIGRWLHAEHARGVCLVSVCSGVFLIAGTGLLDGRVVSTHRSCAQALKERHPRVEVDVDRRLIDHADVLTAGGFMAWVDVGLLLVERLLGAHARSQTARFMLSDDAVREAKPGVGLAPRQAHDDMAVRRAQDLVHLKVGQGITLAAIAAAAQLERRTLLRRFTDATGMTPVAYSRAVRIARARELLEAGTMPLEEVAASLGYVDLSSFSRAFRRTLGVPPGAYRQQFGSAGPREAARHP